MPLNKETNPHHINYKYGWEIMYFELKNLEKKQKITLLDILLIYILNLSFTAKF